MSHSTSHGEKVRFLPASLASPRRSSGPRTAGRWMGRRRLVYEIILYLDKALKGRRQFKNLVQFVLVDTNLYFLPDSAHTSAAVAGKLHFSATPVR